MSQSVFLTRHGQRIDAVVKDWKSLPGCPGSLHLSPHGIEQARALARRLAGERVVHIFASPFYRTVQTANVIAELLDVPVCVERGVCEFLQPRYFPGPLVVPPPEELARTFTRVDLSYRSMMDPQPPETEEDCYRRAGEAMRQLAVACGGSFLIVSHGKPIRGMVYGLLGARPELNASVECGLTQLSRTTDGWLLEHNGDASHLPPKPGTGPAAASQQYITTMDVDPSGRYVYYAPGAHGGGIKDGTPVVQYDARTNKRKIIAFLNDYYTKKYSYVPDGTFGSALSPDGARSSSPGTGGGFPPPRSGTPWR